MGKPKGSRFFLEKFGTRVSPFLQYTPKVIGLTFGIDRGPLVKVEMNEQVEYIGRAVNVACRLQGAIKDKDKNPANKVLISKHAYKSLGISSPLCKVQEVKRRLRNIQNNNELKLVKLSLFQKPAPNA